MSRLKTSFKILSVTSCIWLSYSHTNKRRPNNNRVAPFLAHCSSSEESLQMLFHKARTGDQNFLNNNRNIDVRDTDATGRTVLHMAAMSNNLACVRTLVEKHGADINATDNNNLSVLEYAAQKGNVAIVNYLLEKEKININHKDNFGMTALHKAVGFQHYAVVKTLIDHGADPNHMQGDVIAPSHFEAHSFFDRPLHLASRKGDSAMIKLLCSHQADPNTYNGAGETPLHICCRRCPKFFQSTKLLLDAKQSVLERLGVVDRQARLRSAGECSTWSGVAALLEHGADTTLPLREATIAHKLNESSKRHDETDTLPLHLAPWSLRLAHRSGQLASIAYLRKCLGNE